MPLTGHTCRRPNDILTEAELEQIHLATLQVLDQVGVVFDSQSARDTLAAAGCRVDESSGRVRFPAQLVQECVAQCPSQFSIRARNRDYDLQIGADRLYFQSHPGLYLLDLESGERRPAKMADVGPLCRLVDALDEIHLAIMPTCTVSDKPPQVMTEWITAEQMRNTQKVTAAGVFGDCVPWVIEMATVTGQQVYGQINSVSPLVYPREQIEGGLAYVAAGQPVCILPGPTLGANCPVTLDGALVMQNAEHLAGVVLIQAHHPGAPVTLAGYPHLMDPRDATPWIGGVEVGLLGAAATQLGRWYGIPTHPEFPLTDSKTTDEQAAIEKAMTATLLAQAGANLISNGGALETEKVWSPVQLVIDAEINGMVGRMVKGISVTEETLALDLIQEVGPGGSFLESVATLRAWRSSQHMPHLADRQGYDKWQAQGAKTMVDRARERARQIIDSHRPPPLSTEQDRELSRIVRAAEQAKRQA